MKTLILILGIIVTISGASFAETIGYIDIQKVTGEYNEAVKALEEMEEKRQAVAKEMQEKEKELQAAAKENKDPEEIQKLYAKLEEELLPKQKEFYEESMKIKAELNEKVTKATKKVAKQYGVDIVLYKQALITGGFDLSEYVIDELNN